MDTESLRVPGTAMLTARAGIGITISTSRDLREVRAPPAVILILSVIAYGAAGDDRRLRDQPSSSSSLLRLSVGSSVQRTVVQAHAVIAPSPGPIMGMGANHVNLDHGDGLLVAGMDHR